MRSGDLSLPSSLSAWLPMKDKAVGFVALKGAQKLAALRARAKSKGLCVWSAAAASAPSLREPACPLRWRVLLCKLGGRVQLLINALERLDYAPHASYAAAAVWIDPATVAVKSFNSR
jgi:hypothetical protein